MQAKLQPQEPWQTLTNAVAILRVSLDYGLLYTCFASEKQALHYQSSFVLFFPLIVVHINQNTKQEPLQTLTNAVAFLRVFFWIIALVVKFALLVKSRLYTTRIA